MAPAPTIATIFAYRVVMLILYPLKSGARLNGNRNTLTKLQLIKHCLIKHCLINLQHTKYTTKKVRQQRLTEQHAAFRKIKTYPTTILFLIDLPISF